MRLTNLLLCFCLFLSSFGSSPAISQDENPRKVSLSIDFERPGTSASLRGLCVVSENTVWASGSKGIVLLTENAGKSWRINRILSGHELEYRDIMAFDAKRAIALGAGSPALVFETNDANRSWKKRYENKNADIFFNAFGFWDEKNAIAFSDPIDGKLFLITTQDGGQNWKTLPNCPASLAQEAGFAASGTCLTTLGKDKVWIGLGGIPEKNETKFARVVYSKDRGKSWNSSVTTILRRQSAGVFSIVFLDEKNGFAIGGDYLKPLEGKDNFSITSDGGATWRSPKVSFPTGYRSCIAATKIPNVGTVLLATGPTGTDISTDGGESWTKASSQGISYNQVRSGQFQRLGIGWRQNCEIQAQGRKKH